MQAIELARALVGQGVRAALCTPHYSRRFPTRIELARERLEELRRHLAELNIPLQTALAAEVARPLALSGSLEELQERATNGFLLVELDTETDTDAPRRIYDRLEPSGLRPIFAHPERARSMRLDGAALDEVRAEGALVQVVVSSLAGRRGEEAARGGWEMLDAARVDVVASDAHTAVGSVEKLASILALVARRYGLAATERLTVTTPGKILNLDRPGRR